MRTQIESLENGMRLVAVPMKERRSVSVGVWVGIGARDEEPRLNGVSHFLEHIVFKGTKSRSAAAIKEDVEGRGGSLNAFTAEESTCFLAKSASRHFETVLDVLADMTLSATISDADVEKERTVILEEIKMTQDQPSQLADELLTGILWPGHALGRPIAGTVESVRGLTPSDIRGYRDAFYRPDLLTVVAAGDVDMEQLRGSSLRIFAGRDARSAPRLAAPFSASSSDDRVRLLRKKTEQTHLVIGIPALPREHKDEFALDLLNVILGGNMSSRLFNEVREERGLAYDIGSAVRKYKETGAFLISAGVDKKKISEALKVISAELVKISKTSPAAEELVRAKEFYLGQFELGLENTMSSMLWAGEGLVTAGRCRTPEEVTAAVDRVSPEDILRLASELFTRGDAHLAVVGPLPESRAAALAGLLPRKNP